ncbi:hypothetical protein A2U01_0061642, partial [Trifolium medium]|nr:hypothetical protein [Trifolium medium]
MLGVDILDKWMWRLDPSRG